MGQLHDRMPVILAEIDWPKWLGEEPASDGITQTVPGRGLENLAGRQNGRQRKKQWASANSAGSEQPCVKRDAMLTMGSPFDPAQISLSTSAVRQGRAKPGYLHLL